MPRLCVVGLAALSVFGVLLAYQWAHAQYPQEETYHEEVTFGDAAVGYRESQLDGSLKETGEPASPSPQPGKVDVIRERYPDGSIRVERHVIQDEKWNYVNHGGWTLWSPEGEMLAEGDYWHGQRHGKWTRVYPGYGLSGEFGDSPLFSQPEFTEFERPFISDATFVRGKLMGPWVITDAVGRQIVSWEFHDDKLHGRAIWWYADGSKRREIEFDNGVLNGKRREWSPTQELVNEEIYVDGLRRGAHNETYPSGQKYCEGWYLYTGEKARVTADWWKGIVHIDSIGGLADEQQHGLWTYWHENGNKLSEGEYKNGKPVGRHTWWYANGQKQSEGEYYDGHQDGKWTWWYDNGLKQIEGGFLVDQPAGTWVSWQTDGQVAQVQNYSTNDSRKLPESSLPPSPAGKPVAAPSPKTENRPVSHTAEPNQEKRVVPAAVKLRKQLSKKLEQLNLID